MTEERPLDLSVDRDSELPLATQLTWKLRTLVATGALAPGARLPGVREVAEAAGVNVNTVRSVYGRLEEAGLLSSQHGRGTFVTEQARSREPLARIAAAAAAQARSAGVDLRDVAAALFVSPESELPDAPPEAPPADEADASGSRSQRRELRAQIARLEGELAYLEGPTASEPARRRDRAGQILDAAELEAIRDSLLDRLREARADREQTRHALAQQGGAAEAPRAPAAEPRVWRHGGVWTGRLRPADGVVYES